MASVKVSERIEADADAVWALFRDFGGVDRFAQGIERCTVEGEGVGAVRTLAMPGGLELQERLEAFDDGGRTFQYAIIGASPLPADEYLSTVRVSADGDGCRIDWSSTFQPRGAPEEQVRTIVEGIYKSGIAGIRKTLGA